MSNKFININLIPTPKDFQILLIKLTRSIEINDLRTIEIPKLDSSKGIIISVRGPIWLYLFLYEKIKNVPWIAQYDPRFGALVLKSKDETKFLSKIDLDKINLYLPHIRQKPEIIAFLGPPHSGKSVFLYALQRTLLKENFEFYNNESFIIKGAPDGEGIWSSEISQDLVQIIRYKNDFTENFVKNVVRQIKNISKSKSLVFVDCGGKMDKYNQIILRYCTSAIFVAPQKSKLNEWRRFFRNVKPYAEVLSLLGDGEDICNVKKNSLLEVTMHNLSRGNLDLEIPQNFIQIFNRRKQNV